VVCQLANPVPNRTARTSIKESGAAGHPSLGQLDSPHPPDPIPATEDACDRSMILHPRATSRPSKPPRHNPTHLPTTPIPRKPPPPTPTAKHHKPAPPCAEPPELSLNSPPRRHRRSNRKHSSCVLCHSYTRAHHPYPPPPTPALTRTTLRTTTHAPATSLQRTRAQRAIHSSPPPPRTATLTLPRVQSYRRFAHPGLMMDFQIHPPQV
jgi:hypothetical protein